MTSYTVNQVLYHSLWHFPFFPVLRSAGGGNGGTVAVLDLLDSVGYDVCGQAAAELEQRPIGYQTPSDCAASVEQDLLAHHFLDSAARALTTTSNSSDKPTLMSVLKALPPPAEERQEKGAAMALMDRKLRALIHPLLPGDSNAGGVDDVSLHLLQPKSIGNEKLTGVWLEARLYGFLCLLFNYRCVDTAAKLLALYIACAGHNSSSSSKATRNALAQWLDPSSITSADTADSAEASSEACARSSGVVSGVLEWVFFVASHYEPEVLRGEWSALMKKRGSAGEAERETLGLYPSLEDADRAGVCGVRLLTQLVAQCRTLDGSNSSSSIAKRVGLDVMQALCELLAALTVGASPGDAPQRSDSSSGGAAVVVGAGRGLSLSEADLLTQLLLPRLLCQVGLEWPWSALLKRCRQLDKQPQREGAEARGWVRWVSRYWIDVLLTAVSPHTYRERLTHALPGSWQDALAALELAATEEQANTDGDGGEDDAAPHTAPPVFALPTYYEEPATTVAAALAAGASPADAEEALVSSVRRSLLMVRLRALQAPEDGSASASAKLLPGDLVAALTDRYEAEVLLAALLVHTQLRTASYCQLLLRRVGPLLERRLRRLAECAAPQLVCQGGGADGRPRLTTEMSTLVGDVGYQFYPLEWLPALARTSRAPSACHHGVPSFAYSVYAAVAHQFGLTLIGAPVGSSGGNRSPGGPRSTTLLPPRATDGGPLSSLPPAEQRRRWLGTELFFRHLLLPCLLMSRVASSELEGPAALGCTLPRGETSVAAHMLKSAAPASPDLTARLHSIAALENPAAEEEALAALRLQMGSCSFTSTVLEARDAVLCVAQLLLPSAADLAGRSPPADYVSASEEVMELNAKKRQKRETGGKAAEEGAHYAAALWEASQRWWTGSVAATSLLNALRVRARELHTSGVLSSSSPSSYALLLFNSGTIDCSPLARQVLRCVPRRLVSKARLRATMYANYQRCHYQSCHDESFASVFEMESQLLVFQLQQWQTLVDKLGIRPSVTSDVPGTVDGSGGSGGNEQQPVQSATELLYQSPHFAREI